MRLSIVIPAYNEEKRIGKTLKEYVSFFEKAGKEKKLDYQILVVINNTTDRTEQVVKQHQRKYKRIKYLNLKQGGKGFAIIQGFKYSFNKNFDLIGFVDADLATSPKEYWKLVEKIKGYDGAIADRYLPGAVIIPKFSFRRLIVSRVFNLLVRSLFFINCLDTQCGAKLFKKEAVRELIKEITITQWAFDIDLLYTAKLKHFRIVSVPIIWREMSGGSLNILKASIEMFFAIVQLRILKSPLRKSLKALKFLISLTYWIVKR